MRHLKATWKLGRNTSHRRALLRNLVSSLILEERIETTVAKAKAMRPHVEKMITFGKRGDVAARRLAASFLTSREAVDRLFGEVGPRYGDRNGGYIRIVRTGFRKGDRSEEHTSELQSQSNLVCRLLLEKKQNNPIDSNAAVIGNLHLQLPLASLARGRA